MNFRKLLSGAQKGEKIIPILRAALYDPAFKSFEIQVAGFEARGPDGWFHPSTHPTWPERQLFYYLTEPERLMTEVFDPTSTMAVTQGHFWHSFISKVGLEAGVLTAAEVSVQCDETGARGSMDGTLAEEVFEFKTMRPGKARIFPDKPVNDPELLALYREKQPTYYAQAQEYMRLSGYTNCRTLVLSMEWPFEMREFLIPRDYKFIHDLREKYMNVRQAVADKRMPLPCCGPASKESKVCPARLVCPVAMAS